MQAPRWWLVPTFRDPACAERGVIAYTILRAGTVVSAALLVSSVVSDHALRSAVNYGLLLVLHVVHVYLLQRERVQLATRSFCLCYFALITATIAQFGGLRSPAAFVYPPLVLLAGLIWSSRAAIGLAIACAFAGLAFIWLESAGALHAVQVSVLRLWIAVVAVLFITAIMLRVALAALQRARGDAVQLQAKLDRAERFEALGRLAAGVAHDFNNQLTVMLAHTALLRRAGEGTQRAASIRGIELAAQHAGELTRQLLEFGRQRLLDPSVIDVRAAIADIRSLLTRSLGGRVALRTAITAGAMIVHMDRTALERVLLNLVLNARDAMPNGGEVLLQVRRMRTPGHAKDSIEIAVQDHGTGMDDATRGRIFEPFFTTKAHGHGTGLGLSSVLGVVTASGGDIAVDSAPGQGTRIRVVLPAADESASSE
jgi:signal transduction histidine kinase